MKGVQVHPYTQVLQDRFGGLLRNGKHEPDGLACALEVASIARGKSWTDDPMVAGLPDLRPINDGLWSSDKARTAAITPLIEALWEWPTWTPKQRKAWASAIVLRNVREVLPLILRPLGLNADADACEKAADLGSARSAARAAAESAETAWAETARSAARSAAESAARAAARAADVILALACTIWREEAERVRA